MPKYRVYASVVGSKYLGEFEADNPEQAEELAVEENGHVSFCHECCEECENAEIDEVKVEEVKE